MQGFIQSSPDLDSVRLVMNSLYSQGQTCSP